MRFLTLTVDNFGVFRGEHSFDLAPRFADGMENVVVFSGHNGAGKTSLFTAIQLALHGPLAIGERVSRDEYSEFLFHRLHRYFADGNTMVSTSGGVRLTFEYARSGELLRLDVGRRWTRRSSRIEEQLSLSIDGRAVAEDDVQASMNDLLAPSFLPLMFFDAEQLASLSDAREYERLLQRNMMRLLGLDLAERLDSDLGQYLAREDSSAEAADVERDLQHVRDQVAKLTASLDEARARAHDAEETLVRLRGDLLATERELAAEGGAFAQRRETNLATEVRLRDDIGALEKRLADMAGELLPFTLAGPLTQQLSQRLAAEAAARDGAVGRRHILGWAEALRADLAADAFWKSLRASAAARKAVLAQVDDHLERVGNRAESDVFLHNVSEAERFQIDSWIQEVLTTLPNVVAEIGRQLHALHLEKRRVEGELASAPSDRALQPIADRIATLRVEIATRERTHAAVIAEVGALEFRRAEQQRFCDKLLHDSDSLKREDARVDLARRSRLAIRAFNSTMLREATARFATAFVDYFNLLCRKEELLAHVVIDPETFRLHFEAAAGHLLRLPNFSAGERQLVALAAFWAFRTVARRPMPLAIDTPLGRLDEVHREAVLNDYLPIVADQVLLFATDAELAAADNGEFRNLIARIYHLQFDSAAQETSVIVEERTVPAKSLRGHGAGRRSSRRQ
jgi:DNA sulfur modification protein DndD